MLSRLVSKIDLPRFEFSNLGATIGISIDESASTMAWRINHMCCVAGALAAAAVAATIDVSMGEHHPYRIAASWTGSGLFAFSPRAYGYI